jgi:ABC-type branched-subunit amino acid transport system substrate-binding protein
MTHGRPQRFRGRGGLTRGAVLLVLALLCLPHGAPAASARRPGLDRESRAIAERLYQQLEQARAKRRDRALLELAFELVDRYARFPDNDRVLLLAAHSAWRLGDLPLARQLLGKLRDDWPDSRLLAEAVALADKLNAMPGLPSEFAPLPPPVPAPLPPPVPAPLPPPVRAAQSAPVNPGLIGVLCPLTGGERALGVAFAAGAELAAAHAGRAGWNPARLRVVDTGGDPATAALAARRLVLDEGVVSLVGAVGAGPTAAVAVVADAWCVPFVTPDGGSPTLRDFGPAVVPADLIEAHDARLLARLAVDVERRSRVAVLYPDTPEGARACAAFVMALRETGGRLVGTVACASDGAISEDTLRRLAWMWPEALYLPLAPAAAARLVPRLVAVSLAGLLLGPSGWDVPAAGGLADVLPPEAVCAAQEAVWPRDWVKAFAVAWPGAAPAGAEAGAQRAGRQAYLAVRLVEEALADCGLAPTRETLATALGARWLRLREAPVEAAEAVSGARTPREGRFVPYAAPVPAPGERE